MTELKPVLILGETKVVFSSHRKNELITVKRGAHWRQTAPVLHLQKQDASACRTGSQKQLAADALTPRSAPGALRENDGQEDENTCGGQGGENGLPSSTSAT